IEKSISLVIKLYQNVVEDVVLNVREAFLDEGIDEAVLHELKCVWEGKILATKVIDSLDPNFHMTKTSGLPSQSSKNTAEHHSHAPSTSFQNYVQNRPFPSKIKHSSQISVDLPSAPQHVIMQLSGGSNSNLPNEFGPNLLQTSLTSAIMMQQPQQQLLNRPKYEKITNNLSNMVAQGSNVIVVPPHLQHLASGGVQYAVDSGSNNSQNSTDQPSSSSTGQAKQRLDGPGTASDDDDDDEELAEENDDEEINVEDESEDHPVANVDEGDALNSEDDEVSNENADEMFEADDVVVCQFEKPMHRPLAIGPSLVTSTGADATDFGTGYVNRIRNKWKFVLKDGIINLGRRDYVFNKAVGEAEF
uniref:TFIIA n=1 Tax=Romanomermis culicivorax TaxID=13658 RepID=A0A915KSC9_ROMCU